ncbi:uncharacterized protein LOC110708934 [Chenopodium quinoa]|uniref:uncharacterized protein LOC110708934 n=1 Tax=Chenopodium quinoa TaxID=63459 RepID=UPI000B791E38|nr:uncharacterized protein LOC110708934 [Chenopodium quinoa]
MEKIKQKIKFTSGFTVECEGEGRRRRWGLALLWKNELTVAVKSFSLNHIDVGVGSQGNDEWRFTSVYGHPEDENKYKTGVLLESLKGSDDKPWLFGGDFNLMLHSGEKIGGRSFCVEEAEILRNAMSYYHFEDLGFIGHSYMWTNNRGGEENIQERLDRFFANQLWRERCSWARFLLISLREGRIIYLSYCVLKKLCQSKRKKSCIVLEKCGSVMKTVLRLFRRLGNEEGTYVRKLHLLLLV